MQEPEEGIVGDDLRLLEVEVVKTCWLRAGDMTATASKTTAKRLLMMLS